MPSADGQTTAVQTGERTEGSHAVEDVSENVFYGVYIFYRYIGVETKFSRLDLVDNRESIKGFVQ